MKQTQPGFTLIELMVTVAIVGILAGIAYPSYQDSVRKSRRSDVEGVLLGLANAMERNFTTATATNGYCDVGVTVVANCGTGTGDTGTPSIYTIPTCNSHLLHDNHQCSKLQQLYLKRGTGRSPG